MIYAYTGTPGSGKSYNLTHNGIKALAEGRPVWANYRLLPEYVYMALRKRFRCSHKEAMQATLNIHELRTFEDLVGLYDCILLFDEAHDWLNSRSYNVIPKEIISWWSQHRHAGVDVHLATQRYGSVDAHVRGLIGHVYLCRPAPDWMRLPRFLMGNTKPLIRLTEVMDEVMGSTTGKGIMQNVSRNRVVSLDTRIARCYDTRGGVFPSPLHELEKQQNKHALELDFAFKKYLKDKQIGVADGMPFLTWVEYAQSVVYEQDVSNALLIKFAQAGLAAPGAACPPWTAGAAGLVSG